jgi:hypothetical protein
LVSLADYRTLGLVFRGLRLIFNSAIYQVIDRQ